MITRVIERNAAFKRFREKAKEGFMATLIEVLIVEMKEEDPAVFTHDAFDWMREGYMDEHRMVTHMLAQMMLDTVDDPTTWTAVKTVRDRYQAPLLDDGYERYFAVMETIKAAMDGEEI